MLDIQNLSKNFGGFTALSGIDLNVQPGERLGLIGPNGSGKTTLINCVSGTIRDYEGEVHFNGENLNSLKAHKRARRGISRSFQIPKPFTSMTVKQNLLIPLEYAVSAEQLDGLSIEQQADQILEDLTLADKSDQLTSGLTQIEMRKLELARAMALKPKLLISDEDIVTVVPGSGGCCARHPAAGHNSHDILVHQFAYRGTFLGGIRDFRS